MRKRAQWPAVLPVLFLAATIVSCAGAPSGETAVTGEPRAREIRFPVVGDGIEMVGKARVDLPRARLRGSCRVRFMPPGSLRIDFSHASLFGAWREDATIVVLGDSLAIVDRERGTILAGDDAIDLVAGHLEAPFRAGDLIAAFLFRAIGPGDLDGGAWSPGDGGAFAGRWDGRPVSLEVDDAGRPVALRLRGDGADEACIVAYRWGSREADVPAGYVVTKEFGNGRLSMTVGRAERRPVSPGEFDALGAP